ncbi:MAG: shikimate kinase [Candidatus Thorarchaeota archaeon]|nr:shikimate kinase [Candidatus Thorarchaeota archaeon]
MGRGTTKNIGLIGFMGTGKTTIGRALASLTGRKFFDTDTLVESAAGRTISQIFLEEGEESFRKLESRIVKEVCENDSAVISFGGGVVLSPSNVDMIRMNSIVILLKASVETIVKRTGSNSLRPLLNVAENDVETGIKSLLDSRRILYETAMDFAIETDALSTKNAVEEIIRRVVL